MRLTKSQRAALLAVDRTPGIGPQKGVHGASLHMLRRVGLAERAVGGAWYLTIAGVYLATALKESTE